jgi:hypothetical protein
VQPAVMDRVSMSLTLVPSSLTWTEGAYTLPWCRRGVEAGYGGRAGRWGCQAIRWKEEDEAGGADTPSSAAEESRGTRHILNRCHECWDGRGMSCTRTAVCCWLGVRVVLGCGELWLLRSTLLPSHPHINFHQRRCWRPLPHPLATGAPHTDGTLFVCHTPLLLCSRYTPIAVIGTGAYGVVCSASDNKTHTQVAIKKIPMVRCCLPTLSRTLGRGRLSNRLMPSSGVDTPHLSSLVPRPSSNLTASWSTSYHPLPPPPYTCMVHASGCTTHPHSLPTLAGV